MGIKEAMTVMAEAWAMYTLDSTRIGVWGGGGVREGYRLRGSLVFKLTSPDDFLPLVGLVTCVSGEIRHHSIALRLDVCLFFLVVCLTESAGRCREHALDFSDTVHAEAWHGGRLRQRCCSASAGNCKSTP